MVPIVVTIIILLIIATYMFFASGGLNKYNWYKEYKGTENVYNDNIEYGMIGSPPSDRLDVYDSSKPISIPMEGAINSLIESFKENANIVYSDFSSNRNSTKYKEYVFDDYKLEILRRSNSLSEEQLNKYTNIRNTVVRDINNIFTYSLDKIKYDENKSYFIIKKEILSLDGKNLILTNSDVDNITNYVLSGTKIPGDIIILIKYKLNPSAQDLLDQIVMLAGYNYTTVLEILEHVLVREPLPGISILGVVNSPSSTSIDGNTLIKQGFWTQVYYAFKSSNINNYLVALIKLSYMNEIIYRAVLGSTVSSLQNPKFTEAMNDIVDKCKESTSKIIRTFPYNFTHALLTDAIDENHHMLKINSTINNARINNEKLGISNIDKYSNLEYNFPVSIQNIQVGPFSSTKEFDYITPIYPILSDAYMINDYLSFPNIKHRGIYLDRTSDIPASTSGYIMITNTSSLDLTITGLIIYATLQNGFITDDYRDISLNLVDQNIIFNSAIITIESGRYIGDTFTDPVDAITNNWLMVSPIIIPSGKSIRIRATKQSTVIGSKYLRIYSILIPFGDIKPLSNFLQISVVSDSISGSNKKVSQYQFKNIPKEMSNILCTFDSTYDISPTSVVTDTFKIFNDHLSNNFNRFIVTGANGSALLITASMNQTKSTILTSTQSSVYTNPTSGIVSSTGLVTDTRLYSESNPNSNRSSYRLKFKNTNTGNNPIYINKIITFGDVSASNNFGSNIGLGGIIADDNILLRNTIINAFTMSDDEGSINPNYINNIIVDPNYQTISSESAYKLEAGKSLYIEPTVSLFTSAANRYVCVRAVYVEFSGTNKEALTFSIINLNPNNNNKIASTDSTMSSLWSTGSVFMVLNPIGESATKYSSFSVLPNYKQSGFNVLPNYREDNFQVEYYDNYYNPISELSQYPYNYDTEKK